MKNLKPHKASGPDNIPAQLLKSTSDELAPALTLIFQASLEQGEIPSDWKEAYISPIFKKGDRSKPSNYHPVSLPCICCKTMEHIITSTVMKHLESQNIITDAQLGFRKSRCCEFQLLSTIKDLAQGIEDKEQIDMILLDFSKAFDKVPHTRLLNKINFCGITGSTSRWIENFLNNRTQKVVINSKFSNKADVSSGVPQGTVLGPVLFLIFINDLPNNVNSHVRLFADDCILYRKINSQKDSNKLQEDLDKLQEWEKKWLMESHPDKCQLLRATTKRNIINADYNIHGQTLLQTEFAKYLGLNINNKLSWEDHITKTATKANNTRAFLQRNLRACPKDIRAKCYTTLVRPIVEYAGTVWDPHVQKHIDCVEKVQRRAAGLGSIPHGIEVINSNYTGIGIGIEIIFNPRYWNWN